MTDKKQEWQKKAEEIAAKRAPKVEEVVDKLIQAREDVFAEYRTFIEVLLVDKVVDSQKTLEKKNMEQEVVSNIYKKAGALDIINLGEGSMSMSMTALRATLKIRDRMNELDHRLTEIEKLLKRSLQEKKDETKG